MSRLAVAAVVMLVTAGCTTDVFDSSYANRAEVEADGAIARGWVPEWLPADASQIREVHNLDTNESALSFRLPAGAKWHPPLPCRTAAGGEFSKPRFNREWIPELDAQTTYYSCPAEKGPGITLVEAVAVQSGGQQVLHWRSLAR